jgi:hypothetical protein
MEYSEAHQYDSFRHRCSSRTTFMISPSILFCLTSPSLVSIKTYPPRLIQIVFRNREGNSTRTVLVSGREQEYRLFPSALMTLAMDWVVVNTEGGVEVSSAAAKTFRFGRPMIQTCQWTAKELRRVVMPSCQWACALCVYKNVMPKCLKIFTGTDKPSILRRKLIRAVPLHHSAIPTSPPPLLPSLAYATIN